VKTENQYDREQVRWNKMKDKYEDMDDEHLSKEFFKRCEGRPGGSPASQFMRERMVQFLTECDDEDCHA
jgi:hypothetical protein